MGNVYFIACGETVKIGYAADVGARLAQLQTGNPQPLSILAVIPDCAPSVERIFHRALAAHRVHGEWFSRLGVHDLIREIQGGAAPRSAAAIGQCVEFAERSIGQIHGTVRRAFRETQNWRTDRVKLITRGEQWLEAVQSLERRKGLTY